MKSMICPSVRMALYHHTPTHASNRASLAEAEAGSVSRCFHGIASIDYDDSNSLIRCCTRTQLTMDKASETQRIPRKLIQASIPQFSRTLRGRTSTLHV